MKTKMIIKVNTIMPYEAGKKLKEHIMQQWNNDGIVLVDNCVDIQAIILEDPKGEITVINLKNASVKNKQNILKKIKKLFKKKNKD